MKPFRHSAEGLLRWNWGEDFTGAYTPCGSQVISIVQVQP